MPTRKPLADVEKAARKFRRTQEARDAALADLLEAIRQADAAGGVTRGQLIESSGLARQTVYDALRT